MNLIGEFERLALTPKGTYLFPETHPARYGEIHRRRNLFLPRYVKEGSAEHWLEGGRQDKAYQIICKWANLDASGKLEKRKETELEGEFLTEIFGEALGYKLFSDNEETWNIKPKFSVNGGEADAAIGLFQHGQKRSPVAVVELKGPTANLDKDKFNGRTAVQQCWDYLNELPQCQWGIVSNYVSIRIYHRNQTPRAYEHFALQDLRDINRFREFYYIFEYGGLFTSKIGQPPRAEILLEKSNTRQREIGQELYKDYHDNRVLLIRYLKDHLNKPLETAIKISQRLLDRIIFVAFCEDRGLLPEDSINRAWSEVPPFARVTNPKWQNFLDLFRSIDKGNVERGVPPYNGGLFSVDPDVDDLQLDDDWTKFFNIIGSYDFKDEVNVDVLGHIFERSVNDIERITKSGFFEADLETERPRMERSAERKRFGIYYTPPDFTEFITENTIGKIIEDRFNQIAQRSNIKIEQAEFGEPNKAMAQFWTECLAALREIKIVDPACGSGAFLIQAYDLLADTYRDVITQISHHSQKIMDELYDSTPDFILRDNIFGVDLSAEAVEITQLALWIRSAHRGKTLANLSKNIVCGNSLVEDTAVDPKAMKWEDKFPEIFKRPNRGFDCVIGNPPWERMKLQNREFFAFSAPQILEIINAAESRKLIAELETSNPELYKRYLIAKESADKTLDYVRTCERYELTGKGDINTYAVFAELAKNIVAVNGRVGLLVPSGIATDHTTKDFFSELTQSERLAGLYDFENKAPVFPDVHRSFKFCVLLFGGTETKFDEADFVFFAHEMAELKDSKRHIALSAKDFTLLNPNTKTCPIFRSREDAEITKAIYNRVPVLMDHNRKEGGNLWGIKFVRMFDQSNDSALFRDTSQLKTNGFKRDGANWKKAKKIFLPLYEAKMVQMYDHRAASIIVKTENYMRQGQTEETTSVHYQNPEFSPEPRWWIDKEDILNVMKEDRSAYIAFKDVTSATNLRTMIASFIPPVGVVHTSPLILCKESISKRRECCLLANLNSFAMDFIARQKVGGTHLTFFIVEQLPIFPPDFYAERSPWDKKQTLEKWISERVLKLTCTSNDMLPLAEAAVFKEGVHKWKEDERAKLMAELDAAYFLLYGIERKDVEYILSTFNGFGAEEQGLFKSGSQSERILQKYDELRNS